MDAYESKNSIYHVPSFLVKIYEIVDSQEFNDIVSWTPTGDGFQIKKPNLFSDQILP